MSEYETLELEQPETESISGTVRTFIFERGSFKIGRLQYEEKRDLVFKGGGLNSLLVGDAVTLFGHWIQDPRYGLQFEVSSWQAQETSKEETLVRFLSSDFFPYVGQRSAEKIVDALGESALEKIRENPEVLITKCDLRPNLAVRVSEGIANLQGKEELALTLMHWGVSLSETRAILARNYSLEDLQKSCFAPFYGGMGVTYGACTRIANGLKLSATDHQRAEARIYYELKNACFQSGSTFIVRPFLYELCERMDHFEESLITLSNCEMIKLEKDRVFPRFLWEAENSICDLLAERMLQMQEYPGSSNPGYDRQSLIEKIAQIERRDRITYSEKQIEAIETCFSSPVSILTGGPGTGKTTIVKAILECLDTVMPGCRYQLCAPTGRAAKRLSELTGSTGRTVHSLLGWDPDADVFEKNEYNLYSSDFMIVDEFSMVDTRLFSALLKAMPANTRLLIIGDEEQLESVGEGKVLSDLIASKEFPTIHLDQLYRQKKGSGIAKLSDEIRKGQPFEFSDGVELCAPEKKMSEQIAQIVMEKPNPGKVQILSPKYEGEGGVFELNAIMQELLNPFSTSKPEIVEKVRHNQSGYHEVHYREGDKVMLKVNIAQEGIYNGDIGEIVEIVPKTRTALVHFDNIEYEVTSPFNAMISHAWCVSVHKAQGSEYQDVVFSLPEQAMKMSAKRLVYTAVSRAKRDLKIVSVREVFEICARRIDPASRQTTLKERLRWKILCAKRVAEKRLKQGEKAQKAVSRTNMPLPGTSLTSPAYHAQIAQAAEAEPVRSNESTVLSALNETHADSSAIDKEIVDLSAIEDLDLDEALDPGDSADMDQRALSIQPDASDAAGENESDSGDLHDEFRSQSSEETK